MVQDRDTEPTAEHYRAFNIMGASDLHVGSGLFDLQKASAATACPKSLGVTNQKPCPIKCFKS